MKLFLVQPRAGSEKQKHVALVIGKDEADARRQALPLLGDRVEQYSVQALTGDGYIVHLGAMTVGT